MKSLGCVPRRLTAKEAWFLSPLRQETIASFKVSLSLNRWYDHGQGLGGNVIDLVQTIKRCTVKEALHFLSDFNPSFSFQKQLQILPERENNYEIKRIQPLQNQALLAYLNSRNIDCLSAKKYCQEIYYAIDGKTYFGIAFKNRSGGYELRNKYFKGCIGKKDFTHYEKDKNTIAIFEGFFDFLSFITLNEGMENQIDFLILNSTSLAGKIKSILKEYSTIYTWLDNDDTGKKTTQIIKEMHPKVEDKSTLFEGCKDLNEYLLFTRVRGVT